MRNVVITAVFALSLGACTGSDTLKLYPPALSKVEYTTLDCADLREAFILAADEDLDAIKEAATIKQCDTSVAS